MNINTRRCTHTVRAPSSFRRYFFVEINVRSADNKRSSVFVLPLSYWANKLLPKVIVSRVETGFSFCFVLIPARLPPSRFRFKVPFSSPECCAHVRLHRDGARFRRSRINNRKSSGLSIRLIFVQNARVEIPVDYFHKSFLAFSSKLIYSFRECKETAET